MFPSMPLGKFSSRAGGGGDALCGKLGVLQKTFVKGNFAQVKSNRKLELAYFLVLEIICFHSTYGATHYTPLGPTFAEQPANQHSHF